MLEARSFLYSRREFEHNFNLLQEMLISDRVRFTPQTQRTIDSLLKIKKLPNSRIDLLTINELARVTANSMMNYQDMIINEETNMKDGDTGE